MRKKVCGLDVDVVIYPSRRRYYLVQANVFIDHHFTAAHRHAAAYGLPYGVYLSGGGPGGYAGWLGGAHTLRDAMEIAKQHSGLPIPQWPQSINRKKHGVVLALKSEVNDAHGDHDGG